MSRFPVQVKHSCRVPYPSTNRFAKSASDCHLDLKQCGRLFRNERVMLC